MYNISNSVHPNYEVMYMISNEELPLGFAMALAQHTDILKQFAKLSDEEQSALVNGAKQLSSRKEMRHYVENMFSESSR